MKHTKKRDTVKSRGKSKRYCRKGHKNKKKWLMYTDPDYKGKHKIAKTYVSILEELKVQRTIQSEQADSDLKA